MRKCDFIIIPLFLVALLNFFSLNSFAYDLPDGSVEGLPERLVVLDDSGQSVSDSGAYFFSVDKMEDNVAYTKQIEIINLREDASYRITFAAEPVSNKGEINLEEECECVIRLDDEEIYKGKITGEGTQNITDKPLDLGVFAPGQSRSLSVTVTWNGTSAGGFIDNGQKVISAGGTQITRNASGKTVIQGQSEFKWIFGAEFSENTDTSTDSEVYSTPSEQDPLDTPDVVSTPSTSSSATPSESNKISTSISDFVKTGDAIAVIFLMLVMVATLALIMGLMRKKKDNQS